MTFHSLTCDAVQLGQPGLPKVLNIKNLSSQQHSTCIKQLSYAVKCWIMQSVSVSVLHLISLNIDFLLNCFTHFKMKANMCANKQMHIWTHPHVYTHIFSFIYPPCGQAVKEEWICIWVYTWLYDLLHYLFPSLPFNKYTCWHYRGPTKITCCSERTLKFILNCNDSLQPLKLKCYSSSYITTPSLWFNHSNNLPEHLPPHAPKRPSAWNMLFIVKSI